MATKVCFLELDAFPVLAGMHVPSVGGAEVQQCLIARHLAQQGYHVSFVTLDYGQPDGLRIHGITVYKAYKMEGGIPYLRFFHPRWTGIWSALRRADADIYYQRCAGMETGLLAAFCRLYNRRFVFASGSNTDFDLPRALIPTWRDRWLYVFGLRRADAIIVQSETQRLMLRQNFGLEANIIPNCWAEEPAAPKEPTQQSFVLWVSTLRQWKRPGLFLDLAEALPEVRFVMIGGPAYGEEGLYKNIEQRARRIPNLAFVGFVPFSDIRFYFDRAALVVNTSEPKEGFPNTFLQAWCRGLPVVSFFDPDGIIKRYQLGFVADSMETMRLGISSLLRDNALYMKIQQKARNYFIDNHTIGKIGPRYEALINRLKG
jgi:glycosyltransferase involved in cell wall biosynthesis